MFHCTYITLPAFTLRLCVYRLFIEGLLIQNFCALINLRIICCIYLHGNVQIFDNKRHMCSFEYVSGYFKVRHLCHCSNTGYPHI